MLNRTSLSSSDKLNCLAKVAVCQAHGGISQLSTEFNLSRKTIYQVKEAVSTALNNMLLESVTQSQITVDKAQIDRSIIALSITGANSIRDIVELLPTIYPGISQSFGYIQALQIKAQMNAAVFNSNVSLHDIVSGAIDELFCQNEPVLAGIDLDSGFLFSLAHELHRDGDTWAKILNQAKLQGLDLHHIVKDGGTGMAKGAMAIFPDAQMRDDVFHAMFIVSKAISKVEKRAYRLIGEEFQLELKIEKFEKKLAKSKNHEECEQVRSDIETFTEMLVLKSQKCDEAMERYAFAEKSRYHLHNALSSVHTEVIDFMSPEAAQSLLMLSAHFLAEASHPACDKAVTYLKNRLEGLTLATASVYEKQIALCEHYPRDTVALAFYFFEHERSLNKVSKMKLPVVHNKMMGAYHFIYNTLSGTNADQLMDQVKQMLMKRQRASSAIEGFNALLRPYRYVRKGVSQGFLELFKAWHNLRARRSGKHKGTSAYEVFISKILSIID
jgi:hypothetical protein